MKEALEQALLICKKHEKLVNDLLYHNLDKNTYQKKLSLCLSIEREMQLFLADVAEHKFEIILEKESMNIFYYLQKYFLHLHEKNTSDLYKKNPRIRTRIINNKIETIQISF